MTSEEIKKHDAKLEKLYRPVRPGYGLKRCPFCGCYPASLKDPCWPGQWIVQCRYCISVLKSSHVSRKDAEAKWNKRSIRDMGIPI